MLVHTFSLPVLHICVDLCRFVHVTQSAGCTVNLRLRKRLNLHAGACWLVILRAPSLGPRGAPGPALHCPPAATNHLGCSAASAPNHLAECRCTLGMYKAAAGASHIAVRADRLQMPRKQNSACIAPATCGHPMHPNTAAIAQQGVLCTTCALLQSCDTSCSAQDNYSPLAPWHTQKLNMA